MKSKTLMISAILLFCLTALLFSLTSPAFAGTGCGTNWMGDTTGDTDFYVSKNQNQATSDTVASGASATAAPVKSLGASAAKAVQPSLIPSLTPDKPGPQAAGAAITWMANVTNPRTDQVLYDFLLNGPSTKGQLAEQTGWIPKNTWTWNTTEADVGENQVEVRVKYASSNDFDDRKAESYVITAAAEKNAAASSGTAPAPAVDDSHPASRTGDDTKSKPRVAPDERPRVVPTDSTGPNMNMPEPKPVQQAQTANTAKAVETSSEPVLPKVKVMDVGGKWSVRLENTGSSMDLILIQTGETIMGSGTLNEQNTKIPLIARGSVAGNSLSLDVKTVVGEYVNKIDKRFNLDLAKVDRTISGSYEAYSGEDLTGKGNATASRFGA